jgi:hypothetical protein
VSSLVLQLSDSFLVSAYRISTGLDRLVPSIFLSITRPTTSTLSRFVLMALPKAIATGFWRDFCIEEQVFGLFEPGLDLVKIEKRFSSLRQWLVTWSMWVFQSSKQLPRIWKWVYREFGGRLGRVEDRSRVYRLSWTPRLSCACFSRGITTAFFNCVGTLGVSQQRVEKVE